MEHPKFIGDRSALAVMWALRARGYALLIPFGENTRCDLVIDDGKVLAKVQWSTTPASIALTTVGCIDPGR